MNEDYAAKMALKTDAALREYVTGHYQYREDAVLAALAELRQRGQPAPEEETLRPALEAGAAARRQAEAEIERASAAEAEADTATEDGPVLYSPTLIVVFSIFFNPLAGGVLLGLNLSRLKRWRALIGLAVAIILYSAMLALLGQWTIKHYGLQTWAWVLPLLHLPATLAYAFWFWPRYVGNQAFRSRPWLPPLVICLILSFGYQKIVSYVTQRQQGKGLPTRETPATPKL